MAMPLGESRRFKLYLETKPDGRLAALGRTHDVHVSRLDGYFFAMKILSSIFAFASVALVVFTGTACSKKSAHEDAHPHHHHTAPHGGTLVEVGEHQFTVELVRDAAAGTLLAYILDAHAENFVRVPSPAITLIATVNATPRLVTLNAVASAETGETVGDTSFFSGQADWLKTTPTFDAVIPTLVIHGATFADVKFNFPKGSEDDGH